MKTKKPTRYVVWIGKKPGVYTSRDGCRQQVDKFPGARYQGFDSQQLAIHAFDLGYDWFQAYKGQNNTHMRRPTECLGQIAVDAACSGNPGILEYQWVVIGQESGQIFPLFAGGPYPLGTVNLWEFIALVEAVKYVQTAWSLQIVYTDSRTALSRYQSRQVKTMLIHNETTLHLYLKVDQCVRRLQWAYQGNVVVRKWNTALRGECPADFGRK
jgi:ribonuclease HI